MALTLPLVCDILVMAAYILSCILRNETQYQNSSLLNRISGGIYPFVMEVEVLTGMVVADALVGDLTGTRPWSTNFWDSREARE